MEMCILSNFISVFYLKLSTIFMAYITQTNLQTKKCPDKLPILDKRKIICTIYAAGAHPIAIDFPN